MVKYDWSIRHTDYCALSPIFVFSIVFFDIFVTEAPLEKENAAVPKQDFYIITNNPLVRDKLGTQYTVEFYDIPYEEIFRRVRDQVHQGHLLLSHPLSGSIKPRETPYKSVMVSKSRGALDSQSLLIMEQCIETCKKFKFKYTSLPQRVLDDFQLVDFTLIDSAVGSATIVY